MTDWNHISNYTRYGEAIPDSELNKVPDTKPVDTGDAAFEQSRLVYVTDEYGRLINRVTVVHHTVASFRCINFHANWRAAYCTRSIAPGHYIQADDGYVVKVVRVNYSGNSSVIAVATGVFIIPYAHANANNADALAAAVKILDRTIITTAPHPDPVDFKAAGPDMAEIRRLHTLRSIVRDFFANGYNLRAAIKSHYPKLKSRDVTAIENSKLMGYILMSESAKYFEQSGVTPDVVIKGVHEAVAAANKPDIWFEWIKIYARIHPEIEDKFYKDRVDTKAQATPALPVFMGDNYMLQNNNVVQQLPVAAHSQQPQLQEVMTNDNKQIESQEPPYATPDSNGAGVSIDIARTDATTSDSANGSTYYAGNDLGIKNPNE